MTLAPAEVELACPVCRRSPLYDNKGRRYQGLRVDWLCQSCGSYGTQLPDTRLAIHGAPAEGQPWHEDGRLARASAAAYDGSLART